MPLTSFATSLRAIASRALPQAVVDNTETQARADRYGGLYVSSPVPTKHLIADEGAYYVATNPIIGTGVAHALVTAFADTSALFVVKNNDSPGGKRIYLDYLRLLLTAAPTAGVSLELAVRLDNINRQPTAGSVVVPGTNVNMDAPNASIATISAFNAAAETVPASSGSVRTVARCRIPTGINVVGDEYLVQFGGVDQAPTAPPLTAIRAAQPARLVGIAAPVVIGPGQFAVIHRWSLTEATTAPSYEYELAWWER